MKNILTVTALLLLPFSLLEAQTTPLDSVSYSLGVMLGDNLKNQNFGEINYEDLMKGMKDAAAGNELSVSMNDAKRLMQAHSKKRASMKHEKVIEEGKTFLADNGKKEGVKTTASGLQYLVLKEGTGPKPTKSQKVEVHYEGKLLNGNIFDSSYRREKPTTFGVGQVIAGWTEGLQLMSVGSKYRFFIPENLAYGSRGAGKDIGPYETLIFEVELLDIK